MKTSNHILTTAIIIAFVTIGNFSCQKEIVDNQSKPEVQSSASISLPVDPGFAENDMVMYWNEKAAEILNVHTNPGSDARFFAIIEIAIHDALNSIRPKYQCYALLHEKKQFADPDAAVASAAYWAIKGLNVQKTFPIDAWYNESLLTIPGGESKDQGIALGKKSAEAIIANRSNDGISQVIPLSLFPFDGINPGEYRSTLPASNPDLNLPHYRGVSNWGAVMRPFVTQTNYQFRAPGTYAVGSELYTADYNEVKSKGAMVGSDRTPDEELLARFWGDHKHHIVWNSFTREVIKSKKMDAWKAARLLALIHTAMADGASAMFEATYHFYFWRPETAIRISDDGNPNTENDPSWLPCVILAPNSNPLLNVYTGGVPEYPAPFGILGGTVGQIIQMFFDSDEISVDISSARLPGVMLHYDSISEAVSDNTISKIFCGWHFRKSLIDGEAQGRQIGAWVFNNSFKESNR